MKWKNMFEDRYKISEYGDIISLPKRYYRGIVYNTERWQISKEMRIYPHITKKGYHQIGLQVEPNKSKGFQVHRLVYTNFIGEIPENYDIHHIDENKLNNHYSNLELIEHGKHTSIHKLGYSYNKPKKVKEIKEKKIKDKTLNKTYDIKAYLKMWRLINPNYFKDRIKA